MLRVGSLSRAPSDLIRKLWRQIIPEKLRSSQNDEAHRGPPQKRTQATLCANNERPLEHIYYSHTAEQVESIWDDAATKQNAPQRTVQSTQQTITNKTAQHQRTLGHGLRNVDGILGMLCYTNIHGIAYIVHDFRELSPTAKQHSDFVNTRQTMTDDRRRATGAGCNRKTLTHSLEKGGR